MTTPSFTYWNSVNPTTFLKHDWENPSRQFAAEKAIELATGGTLLEVGPGPGVDYRRWFSRADVDYCGYEGSQSLHAALQRRFPEAVWQCKTIADMEPLSADVVYARHVMEHQPALEPALGQLLSAAKKYVVLTWYRPPAPRASYDIWEGVIAHTYKRNSVLAAVASHGWQVATAECFDRDECWVLTRV
jgi:hypothetical protein